MRKAYPDDLTDDEWTLIEPIVNERKLVQGRPPKYPRREILNAIFYLLRTGCQWRRLPHDFPPWFLHGSSMVHRLLAILALEKAGAFFRSPSRR